jgi:hypothetical protein
MASGEPQGKERGPTRLGARRPTSYGATAAKRRQRESRSVRSLGRPVFRGRAFTTCSTSDPLHEAEELTALGHGYLVALGSLLRRLLLRDGSSVASEMAVESDISAVLRDAEETLEMTRLGLADLAGDDPRRRVAGLCNLVVFGRAVTIVLQNLRGVVGRETFDAWYKPYKAEMAGDELMQYFNTARNAILKDGIRELKLRTEAYIKSLSSDDIDQATQNRPTGASGYLVDTFGRGYWEIKRPDGTTTRQYAPLPTHVQFDVTFRFADPPETHRGKNLADNSVAVLGRLYVEYLEHVLHEAQREFSR